PFLNLRMMTGEEYFGDAHSFDDFGSRVLGIFDIGHSLIESVAFVLSTTLFFDDSWDDSDDSFGHRHRRQFTTKSDKLTK
ncbi:hypothetical protein KAZ93_02940, partial [Patescibacteria group bacterium]|nr:hypothetical protein [Patescibacteria group bacterium]